MTYLYVFSCILEAVLLLNTHGCGFSIIIVYTLLKFSWESFFDHKTLYI